MVRVRLAMLNALALVLLGASVALATALPGDGSAPVAPATVGWPAATLLVSEVETGGASASDEFIELTNAGTSAVDLVGLEVVYVTSSGGTVTRKAAWVASLPLDPGRHLLLANSAGIHAAVADGLYAGGLAAAGGAVVLRVIGGSPIDAVGWGDATNAFVEGSAAPAPAAGSSAERRPGGPAGNAQDTNDNATDWLVQAAPNPQNLSAPPTPVPTASPEVTPSPDATPVPTPDTTATPERTATPIPSSAPTLEPSIEPTLTPAPIPSPTPTAEPSIEPTLTPAPTATPTPAPTASPVPTPIAIADARALPDGTATTIEAVVTAAIGSLESGRLGFVQDATAGIAVYLDAVAVAPIATGTLVRVTGSIDDRYGERTIRATIANVATLGTAAVPVAVDVATGTVGEPFEGRRALVAGAIVGGSTPYADGTGFLVDDGSGSLRVIVAPASLGDMSFPSGAWVTAIGVVGQRDSSGTGVGGYRLLVTEPGDLGLVAGPSPQPSGTPTPSPTSSVGPSPTPSASPSPTASPTPTPSPEPTTISIGEARLLPLGTRVQVLGVVSAEAGRLGSPPLLAVADPTGGLVVKLADGMARPVRGTAVRLDGLLASPYGQLELRLVPGGLGVLGLDWPPTPGPIVAGEVGEPTEARLVTLPGTVVAVRKGTSGDIAIDLTGDDGTPWRAMADGSSGLTAGSLVKGLRYEVTGIVGQRATRKNALDGYRVWIRDRADLADGSAERSVTGAVPAALPIAEARLLDGPVVTVEGVVTAGPGLLDAAGRRIVVEDGTGAIEVVVPAGTEAPRIGERIRATGSVGRAWDAPRIAAETVMPVGPAGRPTPMPLRVAPGPAHEWRLVRVAGTVTSVRRFGSTWRAELEVAGERVVVSGLAGAAIAPSALLEGRSATVTGIVRRPYPSATDRRYAVVPRDRADVAMGPSRSGSDGAGGPADASGPSSGAGSGRDDVAGSVGVGPTDLDLRQLAGRLGATVRVGGLVRDLLGDGFTLDDGTAVARIVLRGEAAVFAPLLEPDEALNAVGIVATVDGRPGIVVSDPAGLMRIGDLQSSGAAEAPTGTGLAGASPAPSWQSPAAAPRLADLSSAGMGGMAPLGLGGMAALILVSVGVTLARRREAQRRVLAAVRARLLTLRRPNERA